MAGVASLMTNTRFHTFAKVHSFQGSAFMPGGGSHKTSITPRTNSLKTPHKKKFAISSCSEHGHQPLVGNAAPDFTAQAVFDQGNIINL